MIRNRATIVGARGKVAFTVTNQGAMEHEMVVVPAPDDSASEAGSEGEGAELQAGDSGRLTVT